MVVSELDAITAAMMTAKTSPENKFCRLCLEENDLTVNLFEEQMDTEKSRNITLSERLFDLFQIKYEETQSLPNNVCKECLQMIESFSNFRENVHKIESELQKHIATLKYGPGMGKIIEDSPRPGLNGEPGVFVPEENAVIIAVNPEQDYESSDDEFSMDSESEAEEAPSIETVMPVTTSTINLQTDSLITTYSTVPSDIGVSNAVEFLGTRKVNETTVLTSSNIVEKSYIMEGAPTKITFSCQYCDMAFSQQNECAEHVAKHDPSGPYLCSFCTMRFINRQHLIAHIRESHDNGRPYVCALCKKGFVRRSDLRKHSIVHTGIRPYTCNICAKSFSRNTNLTKHMRIHVSTRPHICPMCPRSFSTATELARHSRTHGLDKPFHCRHCNASFTRRDTMIQHEQQDHMSGTAEMQKLQSSNLANDCANVTTTNLSEGLNQTFQHQHMETTLMPSNPCTGSGDSNVSNAVVTTSTEDPYRNSILAAQLQQPRPAQLQKPASTTMLQRQSHSSRNFACETCSQTFTRERDYQRHQALHLDTLFACKQCGMGFSRREKLARHELEQHAPQYPCTICRIPFTKLSDFELHMKTHELQQSVTLTAQAASLLSTGSNFQGHAANPQQQQQQQIPSQQLSTMLPPTSREYLGMHQRPSPAEMNFYSQMVPTMNLGFYSETRPEDRNGI